ncbi:large ribosomal subunit protein mL55 [Cottoperca gobio]|uniref:Large ribosomal subunit protein mL55 n=1 Tax=Cottoperca gobio TaxID=56716 RepID=A0A6J2PI49_COTGO|nr:39S ribosomal protein L55, mitochondrial [Cottoperca gobio]
MLLERTCACICQSDISFATPVFDLPLKCFLFEFSSSLVASMYLVKLCAPQSLFARCVCPVFPLLGQAALLHTHPPQLNSNRTSVVRYGRQKYERQYPVMLVRPDGSTVNIRYNEPRRVVMMPVLLSALSEEERLARRRKRYGKKTEEQTAVDFEDSFKADKYSHFWKKK